MRKQMHWVDCLLEDARRNQGYLFASNYQGDVYTHCSPESAQYLARKGLVTFAGKDESGREVWKLVEGQHADTQ